MKKRITILASGEGTSFQAVCTACQTGQLPAEVVSLVTDRAQSGAVVRAGSLGIPVFVIARESFDDSVKWDNKLAEAIEQSHPDVIFLLGFLKKIGPSVLNKFEGQLYNSHPSLLPAYGGKGMFGRKIYEAVLENKEKHTGITIHRVTSNFDEGPVISQKAVGIRSDDSVDSLEARVKEIEKGFLIETLFDILKL